MYPETNAESRWRRANEAVWQPPTAVYENGFLLITLPKAQVRRVPVRVG